MKKSEKGITGGADPRVAYFDGLASGWDGDAARIEQTIVRLEQSRALLGLRAGENLLEVGCGTGQITGWLCSAVAPGRALGIDFSEEMLARARAKKLRAEFRLADICAEAPEEKAFDVALCFHSFPHFRDQRVALQNLGRSRKPGGRLIVMHLAGSEQINAMHTGFGGAVGHDHLPAQAAWAEMLAQAGLRVDERIDRADLFFLRAVAAP